MKSFSNFLFEARTSQASLQAQKLGLTGDFHGGWMDRSGKTVARTVKGKLVFIDGRQAAKPGEAPKEKAAVAPAQAPVSTAKPQVAPQPIPKSKAPEQQEPAEGGPTLTVVFGRFNPPTTGHEKLFKEAERIAVGGEIKIYPSRTQDPKKNPLSPEVKISYMRKMFPDFDESIISDPYMKSIFDVLIAAEQEGYENINIVVGADRRAEFDNLAQKYNGDLYNFNEIQVIPSGVFDADSDSGTDEMSASKMRKAVMNNDFRTFRRGVPKTLDDGEARSLFDSVRQGMKLKKVRKESYALWEIAPRYDMQNLRENYIKGNIFNVGDKVQNLNTGLVGEIKRRGTNYLICVTEDNLMFKSWIKDLMEYTEVKMDGMYREPGKPNTLAGTTGYLKYAIKQTPGAKLGKENLQSGGRSFLDLINKYKKSKSNSR